MSNLTYNPNVNVSYHDSYESPRNDFNRNDFNRNNFDNNYRDDYDRNNFERNNFRNNFENNNYDMPRSLPQVDSRSDYSRSEYSRSEYPGADYSRPKSGLKKHKMNSKKISVNENYENDTDIKHTKISWSLILKKIIIFTALFLLMSSIKMDELVCKFIPYLNENQLMCMTLKGVILSIIIIIINFLL